MLSKLASWIPHFFSPPASDRSGSSQPAPGSGTDAPDKDVRPSAQKLMQRCMGDERENLRKRAAMFVDAIAMHEASNNKAEVQELQKALGEVHKDLAELNNTCQEVAKDLAANPELPPAPPPQAGEEAKQTEEVTKAKPKTERKAKRKAKGTPDTPKTPSPDGEPLRNSHGEVLIRSEIIFNVLPRKELLESLERYRKVEKIDLNHLKQGIQIETLRALPQALELPKAEAQQKAPKR